MAAGVGEEVSSDWLRARKRESTDRLLFLRERGLSDQRIAAIDRIIAERRAGVQTPEKEFLKQYQEGRNIEETRYSRQSLSPKIQTQKRVFQGPVRPGRDEEYFRQTGISRPLFQGPTRLKTDPVIFRRTGMSVEKGSPEAERISKELNSPYLEERVVSTFTKEGREIPVTKIFYVNPQTAEVRTATAKEQKQFREGTRVLETTYTPPPKTKTKFQKVRERVREVERIERAQMQEARRTPFFQLTPPLMIRVGAERTFGKIFDLSTKITGAKLTPTEKIYGRQVIGEVGLFGAFSPVMVTTAQYEKALATRTDIAIYGTTQKQTDKLIRTHVLYSTSKGQQGIGFASSKLVKSGKVVGAKTTAGIIEFKEGFKFPSGKFFIKPSRVAIGKETSISVIRDKIFVQLAGGKTRTAKATDYVEYISRAKGLTHKKAGLFYGDVFAESGVGRFGGFILETQKSPIKFSVDIANLKVLQKSVSSKVITQALKDISVLAIKPPKITSSLITTLTPPIKTIFKPSKSVSLVSAKETQIITTPTIKQADTTKQIFKATPKFKTSQLTKQLPKQLTKQDTKQQQKMKERQLTRQLTKQVTLQQQKMKQRQMTKLGLKQLQRLSLKQKFALSFPKPTPKTAKGKKIILLPFIKQRGLTGKYGGRYSVYIRRYGVFRPVGKGLSLSKAMGLGKQVTSRTLARTYKIFGTPTGRLRTPKGYRRKPTKTGIEFIERGKYALSMPSEKREIQFFKQKKKRKRK